MISDNIHQPKRGEKQQHPSQQPSKSPVPWSPEGADEKGMAEELLALTCWTVEPREQSHAIFTVIRADDANVWMMYLLNLFVYM